MKLYTTSFSPSGRRVLICARELGVALEVIELDFGKREQRAPEYLAKNPMGKVPTLEDGEVIVWESPAILTYLAEKHPDKGLFPTELRGRTETLRWMFWNASHLETYVFAVATERWIKPKMLGKPADEAAAQAALKQLRRFFPVLDGHLKGREFVGARYSIADIALGMTAEECATYEIDLSPFPHVVSWLGRLKARPAWK